MAEAPEGTAKRSAAIKRGHFLAQRRDLPFPMPGRLADGTRVWLHYSPLRWERHP